MLLKWSVRLDWGLSIHIHARECTWRPLELTVELTAAFTVGTIEAAAYYTMPSTPFSNDGWASKLTPNSTWPYQKWYLRRPAAERCWHLPATSVCIFILIKNRYSVNFEVCSRFDYKIIYCAFEVKGFIFFEMRRTAGMLICGCYVTFVSYHWCLSWSSSSSLRSPLIYLACELRRVDSRVVCDLRQLQSSTFHQWLIELKFYVPLDTK